ncbi:hypothetical protein QR680_009461 [Steinernema hermaphroditum]|uniref:PWWP domain-containing protein n=1 Tax=Steinernema hermaphroditum TaxID=289476 RepID=A0AA39M9Q9_9BILA|nr:hypothetical protein QR680_009461 [Steinernema hermaphroditum]
MSSKSKGSSKPVGMTTDAIGEEVVRGDLIWASYRKQPMWPAMVKTVYTKKVTYVFLPLNDSSSHQIFKGDTQSIRVLGSKDVVPDEAPADIKEAFNFALKMINDGDARDRTAQEPVKIEVDEKNDDVVIVESGAKETKKPAKPKDSKVKSPEPKKKAPTKNKEPSASPSPELSPPTTINCGDVVIATSVDGSVSEWPAMVTKMEKKFICVHLFPLNTDRTSFRCYPEAVVLLDAKTANERFIFEIENNANGRSEYSDAFKAVLKHFGVETVNSDNAPEQKENGTDMMEHVDGEDVESDTRKRRTQAQGKVFVAEPKSQKLRRVVDDSLPSSATGRRSLTLYEIMKSDETQSHLRDVLSDLYDNSFRLPTKAKFDFRFDAGDLLTYKELAEIGVVASQIVKLHQGVPKMDPFTEIDYIVSVVLPEMTVFGITKWRVCSRDQALKILQQSRSRTGMESGDEEMAIDNIDSEGIVATRTPNTLFESLVNAACHELSTNGHVPSR